MKSKSKRSARPEHRDSKRPNGARRYSACPVCSSLVAEGWMESHVNLCLDTRQGKAAPCSNSKDGFTSAQDMTPLNKAPAPVYAIFAETPLAGGSQAEPPPAVPSHSGAAGSCDAAAAVPGSLSLSPPGAPGRAEPQLPWTADTSTDGDCAAPVPVPAQAREASLALEGPSREGEEMPRPCSALAVGEGHGEEHGGRRDTAHRLPAPSGAPDKERQAEAPGTGSALCAPCGDTSTPSEGYHRQQQGAEDSRPCCTVPLARAALAQRPAHPPPAPQADVAGASSQLREGAAGEGAGGALPPAPFNFLQPDGALVQPRLWALAGVRSLTRGALPLQRTVVLQSGLVLMRQRLSLQEQQSLVEHTQRISRLFRRPSTRGGGQYHIYCAGWGPRWNPSTMRFVGPTQQGADGSPSGDGGGRYSSAECVPLPASLAALGSSLAQEAHSHSPVFRAQPHRQPHRQAGGECLTRGEGGPRGLDQGHQGCAGAKGGESGGLVMEGSRCRGEEEPPVFRPNICNVNFYPAKAQELGRIALGGHQDLDDTYRMPVVSVSVGDSMSFFFRPLPPLHRRKSGVLIRIDDLAADAASSLGDASHNQERSVILNSGDVLVFGGKSRLVYHGTRDLQPGSRPKGLRMCPGRLNFTFRQHDPPGFVPPNHRHTAFRVEAAV